MSTDSRTSQFPVPPSLLDVLACVACRAPLRASNQRTSRWPALEAQLAAGALACSACGAEYPITSDGIPIVWTAALQSCLLRESSQDSALGANIQVYDRVSSDYARYWRKDSKNARRVLSAVAAACPALAGSGGTPGPDSGALRRHLDVGCGPGHVLHWLAELPTEQFALDVSLSNLRNARASTRAHVVLGSADCMPFRDGAFHLVTESSVLHHIEHWRQTVAEFMRVTAPDGGLIIDCEPSVEAKRWNRTAIAIFEARWYPYMLASLFSRRKFWFRDVRTAQMNFEQAEIHNRPNTGLPVDAIESQIRAGGFSTTAVRSPDERLRPRGWLSWQEMILHGVSGHNPFSSRWGWFTMVARRDAATDAGAPAER